MREVLARGALKRNRSRTRKAARAGAAVRRNRRLAALVCGLLCCAVLVLRACARQAAPEGCSLHRPEPAGQCVFPLGTSSWRLSSGYGWRQDPLDEKRDFHTGADLACAEGTPVLAAMDGIVLAAAGLHRLGMKDGIVLAARRSASYGNCIRLAHKDGVETLYAHMQYLYVRPGQLVEAGQTLGTAGQTGRATGPHLHFELLYRAVRCDPSALLGLDG